MDWALFDQESAVRQRCADLEDANERCKAMVLRAGGTAIELEQLCDISWIYHTNALEGVVLSYADIKSVVEDRMVSDASLWATYRGIRLQKRCIDTFRRMADDAKPLITLDFLNHMHAGLIGSESSEPCYRRDIPIHRTYFHEIVIPEKIPERLVSFLEFINSIDDIQVHPVEFAAQVHHRFMHVFPYSKHSGTLGRLLWNYVLMRHHLIPTVIHGTDRQQYYEALRGSEKDFRVFCIETIGDGLENIWKYFAERQGARRA